MSEIELCGNTVSLKSSGTGISRASNSNSVEGRETLKVFLVVPLLKFFQLHVKFEMEM